MRLFALLALMALLLCSGCITSPQKSNRPTPEPSERPYHHWGRLGIE